MDADLPAVWTPIAVRRRQHNGLFDAWRLLDDAMIDTREAARLRDKGLLLTAHRHVEGRIELVVKAATGPVKAEQVKKSMPSPGVSTVATAERIALLEAEYPAGVSIQGIFVRFNALPGEQTTVIGLSRLASRRGLKRPPCFSNHTAPMTLAEIQAQPASEWLEVRIW